MKSAAFLCPAVLGRFVADEADVPRSTCTTDLCTLGYELSFSLESCAENLDASCQYECQLYCNQSLTTVPPTASSCAQQLSKECFADAHIHLEDNTLTEEGKFLSLYDWTGADNSNVADQVFVNYVAILKLDLPEIDWSTDNVVATLGWSTMDTRDWQQLSFVGDGVEFFFEIFSEGEYPTFTGAMGGDGTNAVFGEEIRADNGVFGLDLAQAIRRYMLERPFRDAGDLYVALTVRSTYKECQNSSVLGVFDEDEHPVALWAKELWYFRILLDARTRIHGQKISPLSELGNYGFPVPRATAECDHIDSCTQCQQRFGCAWCLTPKGQICSADCSELFFKPYDSCSAWPLLSLTLTTLALGLLV